MSLRGRLWPDEAISNNCKSVNIEGDCSVAKYVARNTCTWNILALAGSARVSMTFVLAA